MNKEALVPHINAGLSIRQIAQKVELCYSATNYWIKKHGLKSKHRPLNIKSLGCLKCGTKVAKNFYGKRKTECRKCFNKRISLHRIQKRRKIVDMMGGKCRICGYNKYECALAIHHLNPKNKDRHFDGHLRSWNWTRIKKEIANCILVCHNCHSALHAGLIKYAPVV